MNIAFVPIDNRPVCYTLPEQIAKCSDLVKLYLPDRNLLGSLTKFADTNAILNWLAKLENIDAYVISLDTVAYGGLISSRRSDDSFDEIKNRLSKLKKILKDKKVYAFSSIMRISNNNINEEEKIYWKDWGKKIFEYSYNFHKNGTTKTEVPQDILKDYLQTRERNFEINKMYLECQKEGLFETLIFSKDDCAEFGLNVMEANEIEKLGGFVKTGDDEIPLSLLARSLGTDKIKIAPIFLEPKYKNLISNYEDVSIEKSVQGQIELAGLEISEQNTADILLFINNFKDNQGEIVMKTPTEPYQGSWDIPQKPYLIADVRFANGADNIFVEKLFEKGFGKNFLGYSAWNTTANTLGSLICAGKMKYLSSNGEEFTKLQIIRFLDDWAYQANVRQILDKPDEKLCKELMKPFEEKLWQIFDTKYNVTYKFPWNRLFEVEIELS